MKKIVRGLLKVPFTPFVVAWGLLVLVVFYVVMFFQYIYEVRKFEKEVTQAILDDQYNMLKRWFTTV